MEYEEVLREITREREREIQKEVEKINNYSRMRKVRVNRWNYQESIKCICALGYENPTKVAPSNQQKRAYTTCSKGMFLLLAACHLSRVFVAQSTVMCREKNLRKVRW